MIQKNPYFKNVPSKNTSSTHTKMDKAQEREREKNKEKRKYSSEKYLYKNKSRIETRKESRGS